MEDLKKIVFKHWKTGELLEVVCSYAGIPDNPASERLVVYDVVNKCYEDIIKSTIVRIEDYDG